MVGGVLVIALGFAAWVAPFALTETSCWVARAGADGTPIYAPIPVPAGADSGGGSGHVELGLQPTDLGPVPRWPLTQIALGAVAAGWIVGGSNGSLDPRQPLSGSRRMARRPGLVLLPLDVVGSTWEEVQAGRVWPSWRSGRRRRLLPVGPDPVGIAVAAGGYFLYGTVSALYTLIYLLPFGAASLA